MLVKLFNAIREAATPTEFMFDGRRYVSGTVQPIREPMPNAIAVDNLSSLVDYVNLVWPGDTAGSGLGSPIIHIQNPTTATVNTFITGKFEQRKCYLIAHSDFAWNNANHYMTPEQFIIMIQSQFLQDDETTALLKLVGNIEDSAVKKFDDDGVTQQVTARVGLTLRKDVPAPSRINLTPFRSFVETTQVQSQFILRMQSGKGDGAPPQIALFEADGGAWRNQAMRNIKSYLQVALPGAVILA